MLQPNEIITLCNLARRAAWNIEETVLYVVLSQVPDPAFWGTEPGGLSANLSPEDTEAIVAAFWNALGNKVAEEDETGDLPS